MTRPLTAHTGKGPILSLALIFFAASSCTSYARWANFEYRTFDLAYYVQSLWQLIHGRFEVSVEGVPLLGNHVEPIILLIAPIFALIRHPLVLVMVQNAALASMGPVAFSIAQRIGFGRTRALLLASAILLTPATGYIALHEFHPEAFTAPFILLMIDARLRSSLLQHWVWLIATLACKENMALLIATYCAVQIVQERKHPLHQLLVWYLLPIVLSLSWFLICIKVITPALNAGNIDYLALYDRLGNSGKEILLNAITEPQKILGAIWHSLFHGNLLWALLLPFLAVPLVRAHWLLIALPILLQHLLSWRTSEWTIYFHYAAPLLPFFWIALAEGSKKMEHWSWVPNPIRYGIPYFVLLTCMVGQAFVGPLGAMAMTTANWFTEEGMRGRKQRFIDQIPANASVVAPLPYLSHLAMRENLYSLHYILKGLKTLSRSTYSAPTPTDAVLIDYNDSATFDSTAGYYHPAMKTVDGRIIPSSDELLHEFLRKASWEVRSSNELTLFERIASHPESVPPPSDGTDPVEIARGITLVSITKFTDDLTYRELEINLNWDFQQPRDVFPWMVLRLTRHDSAEPFMLQKGLCGPEAPPGSYRENWKVTLPEKIPPGEYQIEALFIDNKKRLSPATSNQLDLKASVLSAPVPLGSIRVTHNRGDSSQR